MALHITSAPASVNFSRNPIIFKVSTTKILGNDESMLRIVCRVKFEMGGNVIYSGDRAFEDELSQPVGNAGDALFNLSDLSETLFIRLLPYDMVSAESPMGIQCTCSFHETWVKDGYEVKGEATADQVFRVVPGQLTDYELMVKKDFDLSSMIGNIVKMSRKPDMGIVYNGETIVLPVLHNSDNACQSRFFINGEEVEYFTNMIYAYQTSLLYKALNHSFNGELLFKWELNPDPLKGYFRANSNGVHFLRFINGFGAVENISVRVKDKLSYSSEGEEFSIVQDVSGKDFGRRYAKKSQPVGSYELSSGYVPRVWAEWYVQELLTSPRVWIQIDGRWVPALIESEDECVIYDKANPEMPHVDFTLKLAIDGVTECTW